MRRGKKYLFIVLALCSLRCFAQYMVVGDTVSQGVVYKNIPDIVLGNSANCWFSSNDSTDIDFDSDNI